MTSAAIQASSTCHDDTSKIRRSLEMVCTQLSGQDHGSDI
jgi:hypothetical protein